MIKLVKFSALSLFIICFMFSGLVYAASTGSATITWTANTEDDLNGYNVYMGTTSGTYDPATFVDKALTEHICNNLNDNQTYYFCVTATDGSGNESSKSAEVSKNIPDITPPVTPQSVTVR